MKLWKRLVPAVMFFVFAMSAWGEPLAGIVVQKVLPRSAAEVAGLLPGDVLLSWARGSEKRHDRIAVYADVDRGGAGTIRSCFLRR